MVPDQVHFLGVEAETGEATHLPRAALVESMREWRWPRRLQERVPADDLSQAGWGVMFPEVADPAVREALRPLLRRRREQAGDRFADLAYRPGEGTAQFLARRRSGFGPVDPTKLPYYLLLVGDAEQIPHGFQAGLDVSGAIGRLQLPTPAAYAAYAEAVCRAEDAAAGSAPKVAVFSPAHDNDVGTRDCVQRLASGMVEHFAGRGGGQLERALIGRAATRAAFLELLAAPEASVILTAGHGVMYAAGHLSQRRLQGSLVCADWSGAGRVEMDHLVQPAMLPAALAGGGRVLFLFGCYTGGTPRLNGYDVGPRAQRRLLTENPFVAALPQALLERGALAVIAHVDQACTDAFVSERYGQVGVFTSCVASILDGCRVGFALEPFAERYAALAAEMLAGSQEIGDPDVESLGLRLWTAYHDARGMVVLGDPAVRLTTPAATVTEP